ncbi:MULTISPECIES: RHS repeat domain-containing protein [Xanthomonas]|uniref:RHS repeat domain-containing protein n=1 Tax=Xanthomonas TaxID=338 RepID=UPI000AD522E0|nr:MULTISPECIES: RHS repeat-associated core domain-containing protein [Xanthomonas]
MDKYLRINGVDLRILLMFILCVMLCPGASAQVVRYVHTDGLGSVSVVTDANRNILDRREYEPYGSTLSSSVDGIGYTGHVMDAATGLTYMQQRYYDPQIGRFITSDPVATKTNSGFNFNRYWYANNNPYKFIDPDGRAACPGTSKLVCIQADTFKSESSSGKTVEASTEVAGVMVAEKGVVAVTSGSQEKMGFVVKVDGALKVQVAGDAKTNSDAKTDSASAVKPEGALAVVHGHIDGRSDGVISPADASPLKSNLPNGVVSTGRVGVTELIQGRLQFRMLEGKMTQHEAKAQQRNLDRQQGQF